MCGAKAAKLVWDHGAGHVDLRAGFWDVIVWEEQFAQRIFDLHAKKDAMLRSSNFDEVGPGCSSSSVKSTAGGGGAKCAAPERREKKFFPTATRFPEDAAHRYWK